MADFGRWKEYSELNELESDSDFVDSFIPGNSFVKQAEDFGDSEHVESCSQLAVEGGFEYSDDRTALMYSLDVDNPLIQQALEIDDELKEGYEKAVRAGVNIGLGFRDAIESIESQAGAGCRTDFDAPNVPHLEKPHEPSRSLAYFVEEATDTANQGLSAGILASAYFELE